MSSTNRTRTARRSVRRRTALVGVIAAGSLLLAACGNDDSGMDGMDHGSDSTAAASKEPGKDTDASADFNDADVTFAQGMIPHHQQAIEMSELAETRASDPEIKKLAGQIKKAQDPEIKTLQGWLKSWGKPTEAGSGMDHSEHGGMDGMDGMDGMMSEQDMKDLEAAKGTKFDRAFAEMMIEHHNGAIKMAEDEKKNGKSADAKKMADAIIKGQSAEVDQFEKILDRI
ncbi:DUF305 domain-containing protein [Streptomyces luteolus]|uniref:DUF305 domain-containing protein n=1 Tax=Streptomyces luteolus TaxID=3043615 RepID=A0ABT6SZ57_9ACTN|nr:DUF305 domain-containing protein [Streptomyces sp. B-S-A12]MDI3420884.1 DUF305 domain-containing protein [Streptomyces sp. B-S-A12]